ncbi:MAG: hypothetical protein ACTSUE_21625 [Promethearchaeota archaeon]
MTLTTVSTLDMERCRTQVWQGFHPASKGAWSGSPLPVSRGRCVCLHGNGGSLVLGHLGNSWSFRGRRGDRVDGALMVIGMLLAS